MVNEMNKTSEEKARKMLSCIPCIGQPYQDWLNLGMALHDEGLPCSLWDEWSQTDPGRYHPGECEKKWKSFGKGQNKVTIASLYYLARSYGYKDDGSDRKQGNAPKSSTDPNYNPVKDITEYLTSIFEPDDYIAYVTKSYIGRNGKSLPNSGVYDRTCAELIHSLNEHPDDLSNTFGAINEKSGAWICPNPTDGLGRKNSNIAAYRYALVENDDLIPEEQLSILKELQLPIKLLIYSGGRSFHALVPVFALDQKEYDSKVRKLFDLLAQKGFPVDQANKNCSRLSRFPGFKRDGRWQYIAARNLGLKSFDEWEAYITGKPLPQALDPMPMKDLLRKEFKPLYEPVQGLFTEGLNIYVGASKLGKSWHMLQCGFCVSSGRPFWNRAVTRSPVLYLALEDSERRIKDRLSKLNITEISDDYLIMTKIPNMDSGLTELLDDWLTKQARPCLIIVDVFQKIKGRSEKGENAYESDYRIASSLKATADKHRACIICVHHTNKLRNTDDIYERISGSNGLMACADNTALLQRERNASVATVNVTGRDVQECEITLSQINGQWTAETAEAQRDREMEAYRRDPAVIMIRKLMAENPEGGFISYSDFIQLCAEKTGRVYKDGKEVAASFATISQNLKLIDQIEVITGIHRSIAKQTCRGFLYQPVKTSEYQQKLSL